MRDLLDGTNVDPADADYPNGRVRDKVGLTPGTIWNEIIHGDIYQTFQKFIIEAGTVTNGLPDNVTNGYQLFDAIKTVLRPYKIYTALMTQTGTNDPVVTVLQNELNADIVWTRDGASGVFIGTLAGAFTANKTTASVNVGAFIAITNPSAQASRNDDDQIALLTRQGDTPSDDILGAGSFIEIRVYE